AYIPSCVPCQCNKNCTTKPTGLLHSLPVPDNRFSVVRIDFISPLPEEGGKDIIMIIMDLLGMEI
ncbi:hypothetical protein J132_02859, partial [Termitomyces sp. J132]